MARAHRHRFEGHYGITLVTAIAALVPFIVFTAAFSLLREGLIRDLHASPTAIDVANGLATAGYAFGALVGGDLIQRFQQRYLFLLCEGVFVAGAVIAAAAHGSVAFGAGYVLQGLATGLLLVVALPPVIQQFPAGRLPLTAAAIDLGFFGGVTLGPLIGGPVAAVDAWRWLFAALAVLGIVVSALAAMTLAHKDPPNPNLRFDRNGVGLGFVATVLSFFAAGELTGHGFGAPVFWVPFVAGTLAFLALLIVEFYEREPISPVKLMWSTMPVVGVIVAMVGGGAYFTFFFLAAEFLVGVAHRPVLEAGAMFWPQVAGALVASASFGLILRTRLLPAFALAGMLCVIAGGALLFGMTAGTTTAGFGPAVGLMGFGAGATVAPGLWFASLSLQSKMVGRIFALVELVRSEANYLLAPIMVAVAVAISGGAAMPDARGIHDAVGLTLIVTVALSVAGLAVFFAGGAGMPKPDLAEWLKGDRPAWQSPQLFAALRGSAGPPAA